MRVVIFMIFTSIREHHKCSLFFTEDKFVAKVIYDSTVNSPGDRIHHSNQVA